MTFINKTSEMLREESYRNYCSIFEGKSQSYNGEGDVTSGVKNFFCKAFENSKKQISIRAVFVDIFLDKIDTSV